MKLIHLIEYSLEKEIKMRGHKLLPAIKNDTHFYEQVKGLDPEDQMQVLYQKFDEIDPTPNLKFVPWIAKQYSDQKFRIEDLSRISSVLSEFKKLQPHLKKYGHSADLNQYNFHSLEEIIDSIQSGDDSSDHQSKRLEGVDLDEVEVLYDGPYGLLVIPETEEASCELGRGTKWCTAARSSNNMYRYYTRSGPLYIWIDKDGSKYQFHFETMQFMDDKDVPIGSEKLNYFRTEHPILKKLFREGEKEIAKQASSSTKYAENIIKSRFELGEPAILAAGPYYVMEYVNDVIKGPWPEGEKVIASDAESAYTYAKIILGGHWPKGEPIIATNPAWSYHYAKNVLKGPFKLGEDVIKDDPYFWYQYQKDVLKIPDEELNRVENISKILDEYNYPYEGWLKTEEYGEVLIVDKLDSITDFIEEYLDDNSTAHYIMDIMNGDNHLDFGSAITWDDVENFLEAIMSTDEEVYKKLMLKIHDCAQEHLDEDLDINELAANEIIDLIRECDEDLTSDLFNATINSYESGTYDEMYKVIMSWAKNDPFVNDGVHLIFEDMNDVSLYEPVSLVIEKDVAIDDVMDTITRGFDSEWEDLVEVRDIVEPRYGYQSLNVVAGIEYLKDHVAW